MKQNCTKERTGFVFYRSFFDAISDLSAKEKLAIYEAISTYALEGIEPTMDKVGKTTKALWLLIKPLLDNDIKRYENGCKGAESGKKGGAPAGNDNAKKKQPQNNPIGLISNNPETTPLKEKEKEKEIEKEKESECVKSAHTHAHTQEDFVLQNFEKWCSQFAPTLLEFAEPMTAIQLDELRKKNSDSKIKECAAQVHNKSAYQKNRSAFLTMRKWMATMKAS